ncbi:hypothetical protein KK083_07355 [Fulvivirgaceae bacterium PWU4]|uniref:Uncharacterized protein n=1 Tax=Chryseosolibacter histidini TaxID=2782349 RepID=A0AAP2GI25_9BACT|nr:hypothetical protein [Chryseosolibacter histidini]MBT1696684.1 hypothetical protein [Chryseosolibacter histidini]
MAVRFDLNKGLCEAHATNSLTFSEEGNDLFLVLRVKIKKSQPYPGENSGDEIQEALANDNITENCRSSIDPAYNHLKGGVCEVEIRKNDLKNITGDSTLTIRADIDPKLPYTSFGVMTLLKRRKVA